MRVLVTDGAGDDVLDEEATSKRYSEEAMVLEDGPPSSVRNYRCVRGRLGARFPTTPMIAVAELVEKYGWTPVEEPAHQRYYEIARMELLEEAHPAYQAMQNIFQPMED